MDFWIDFLGSASVNVATGYFFWKAVFDSRDVTEMQGYTLSAITFYYLLVSLVGHIVRLGDQGTISPEIYDGTLTRYLLYPVPFFQFKYVSFVAVSVVAVLQLVLGVGVYAIIFGSLDSLGLTPLTLILGVAFALAASYLAFSITAMIEYVAFWADNVWSLVVLFKMTSRLLAGALVPIVFFPDWARGVLQWLPFPYLIAFPIETMLGRTGPIQWVQAILVMAAWSGVFTWVSARIWKRGLLEYSGVGI